MECLPAIDAPIFVLCAARSGSTLLRLLLDSHSDIYAPAETSFPETVARMAHVCGVLESGGSIPGQVPEFSEPTLNAVRSFADLSFGRRVAEVGKRHWCDKSLGTSSFHHVLRAAFPSGRYIALYRDCRDLIASALEACPWGLTGYGFDQYRANSPNNVHTLANYWYDQYKAISTLEKELGRQVLRVHYEELVQNPRDELRRIFEFLEVSDESSDVIDSYLTRDHEEGPGDHKVWFSRSVNADSVGRGSRIPMDLVSDRMRSLIDELSPELGYRALPGPLDVGSLSSGRESEVLAQPENRDELLHFRAMLAERAERLSRIGLVAASSDDGLVGLVSVQEDQMTNVRRQWQLVGTVSAWSSVLVGDLNMGLAVRTGLLQYSDSMGQFEPNVLHRRVLAIAHALQVVPVDNLMGV